MQPTGTIAAAGNLRSYLRSVTADAHDRLDRTMREKARWETSDGYARFLALQFTARKPLENWIDAHAPAALVPPHQSPLIAGDLLALGAELPSADTLRISHADTSESAMLGAAWVLAGSSLGNHAILAEIKRACAPRDVWPHGFLGDDSMRDFWKALRVRIERPAKRRELESARDAAIAVFAHFLETAQADARPLAECA